MTILYVLGSGSRGNCFAVEHEGAALMIDAGFGAREIERRAERAGLALERVGGIVLTHEHGDHARGACSLARRLRVPLLTAPATQSSLGSTARDVELRCIGFGVRVELGPFVVRACPTSHDAAEPLAVTVVGSDGVSVGVAYDLGRPTAAVRYLLRQLTAIVLEANHDDVWLRTSEYPPSVQRRIAGSGGHLSNRAAAELLLELHHPGLAHVVLAHLSQQCNTPAHARREVLAALRRVRFHGELHVAEQDEPLPPIRVAARVSSQLSLAL